MHPTRSSIFPAPAASSTRRTAAGVKADRRSPAGPGLDPDEDRRTLATAGTANTQVTFTRITCIMPMSGRGALRSPGNHHCVSTLVERRSPTKAGWATAPRASGGDVGSRSGTR